MSDPVGNFKQLQLIRDLRKTLEDQEAIRRMSMDGLTEGRIVHFVMNDGDHRAAIVVKVWNKDTGVSNLTVFTDHSNDIEGNESQSLNYAISTGILWRTSVEYSEEPKPNTWHWIEHA